jgi:hypothetical protein
MALWHLAFKVDGFHAGVAEGRDVLVVRHAVHGGSVRPEAGCTLALVQADGAHVQALAGGPGVDLINLLRPQFTDNF